MIWTGSLAGGLATWGISRLAPFGNRWLHRTDAVVKGKQIGVIGDSPQADGLVQLLVKTSDESISVQRVSIESIVESIASEKQLLDPAGRQFDEIYIAESLSCASSLDYLVNQLLCRNKSIIFAPALIDLSLYNCRLSKLAGLPLLTVGGTGFTPLACKAKRVIDVIGSFVLIMLLSPILIALMGLLRMINGSPVLFRQKRVGRAGKLFTLFKFRTMRCDAEAALTSNPELYREYIKNNYKLPLSEDVRIARLGRFLRASSLDELPQLFNVLRGEMSLVGPRPVVPNEVEKFGAFAPLILSVRPGLTGLWQVNGRSLIGDYEQRIRLNIEYIRDGSIIRDFAIIAKTLLVVLRIKHAGWERETPEAIVEEISSEQASSINDGVAIEPQADGKRSVADHHAGIYGLGLGYTNRPLWRGRAVVDARSSYRPRNTRHTDSSG